MADGLWSDDLTQWEKRLLRVIKTDAPREYNKTLNQAGHLYLRNVALHTPVDKGRLRASINLKNFQGKKEGVLRKISSDTIEAGTNVEYALWVEKGYIQKPRWVPGYWKNGRFYYDSKANTGMMLKNRFIVGRHMFEKGKQETERQLPELLKNFIRRMGKELGMDVSE